MKYIYTLLLLLIVLACSSALNGVSAQDTIVLPAMKHNTLFEDDAKKFDSRELKYEPFRPRLKVVYSAPDALHGAVKDFQVIAGSRAYPNPFSDITTIEYTLAQRGAVEITIINILGQEVLTLVDENQSVGMQTVTWDGMNGNGKILNNGIYYAYIRVGKEMSVIKILKTQ